MLLCCTTAGFGFFSEDKDENGGERRKHACWEEVGVGAGAGDATVSIAVDTVGLRIA